MYHLKHQMLLFRLQCLSSGLVCCWAPEFTTAASSTSHTGEAAVQPSLELLSTQLGIALWVHLGRLCVCLKMCCRSRGRCKCSLVNLQIFINLTLKSFVCCSLKKLSLVYSHPPCCLPLSIAQK